VSGGAAQSVGEGAPLDPSELDRPWLSRYPPGVPPTYDYPDVPLTRFVDDAARDFPDIVATTYSGARTTYADLLDHVDRLAAALEERDVGRTTPVGIALAPSPAAVIATFAVLRLGAVVVPIPPDTGEDALHRRLRSGRCEAAVVDAVAVPHLNAVRARLPQLRHVVATGIEEWLPFPRDRLFRLTGRRRGYRRLTAEDEAERMGDLLAATDPIARQARVGPEDVAVSFPDSGPARLTHAQLLAAAFQARLWVPDVQAGREHVLVAEPLATPHALVWSLLAPVLAAASLHLVPDPTAATEEITAGSITLLAGSPALFDRLAETAPDADLSSLRVGIVDGVPDHAAVDSIDRASGARIRGSFSRPAAPFALANPVYGRAGGRDHLGLPVTDTVGAVVDPAGRPLPPGGVGRLLVAGPQVVSPTPWLDTGELVTMTEDGSFRVSGEVGT
jgi:long-chain acyl-CoA synthetase